ncbi:hypothetical protein BD780_002139 [Clostridium tetanomorphum]|uniref:Uncharacterized protein n=1 Tax=Clostridium tetanomorphum TaxID=1553 RepID=A0A923E4X9_CLOTT|nr:hypothetical protein [Clostridium tetanomorphum]KAJ51611.1 hypothetical protein CTM_12070 [Clostridium tetanomorphum DSM 665]MBC2396512.1 hypothetical protein [Clostridium tetanomorphum]MBP1863836.1 hypothetical protein [Clostridium tetanomorphum]NRS84914.1 hypothetical protein [Clostridium tetanomorphum]NRZ98130.1 hypothetical protein [Clostridium tetanomorphum]
MIAFKQMWNDVIDIISKDKIEDIQIIEKYNDGFIVKDSEGNYFIDKQDFIDFWCNMLYFNELPMDSVNSKDELKFKYVYAVVKNLPYINENCGTIKLME